MLKYVYDRLELLADEANHYILKENKLNINDIDFNLESIKSFMAKVKDAFKELPEALDEIEWLEMVLKNTEQSGAEKTLTTNKSVEPEKE